jgi:galactitol-specific phosphotransferase system IIC component
MSYTGAARAINRDGRSTSRIGVAWVALSLSLLAHVVDEALTGFLDVYNPIVLSIRARYAWFPMPTFTFGMWLAGLCALVFLLLAWSPLAFRRSRLIEIAAYPYAAIMFLNGIGHLVASIYLGRWAPGATTAPLLIAASLWLADARTGRTHRLRTAS